MIQTFKITFFSGIQIYYSMVITGTGNYAKERAKNAFLRNPKITSYVIKLIKK